jgi:hypothetical protein
MKSIIRTGTVIGTGAAKNVELGFIPTCVQLFNASDGTLVTQAWLQWVVPFSSGGDPGSSAVWNQVAAGSAIKGITSLATAIVQEVLLSSTGSFGAGTAAGFLVLQEGSLVGTFQSENIAIQNPSTTYVGAATVQSAASIGVNDATVTVNVVHNLAIAAAAASATGTSAISRYEGSAATNSKGFTIGSVICVADKALRYLAVRDDG